MHVTSVLSIILVALGCISLISASTGSFDCKCSCCIKPKTKAACEPTELKSVKLYKSVCVAKQCVDACTTEYPFCNSGKAVMQAECIAEPAPGDTSAAPTATAEPTTTSTATVTSTSTSSVPPTATAEPTTTSARTAEPTTTSMATAEPTTTTTTVSTTTATTQTPWPVTTTGTGSSTPASVSTATVPTQTSQAVTTTTTAQTGPTVTTTPEPHTSGEPKSSANALKSVFSHFVIFSVVLTFFNL